VAHTEQTILPTEISEPKIETQIPTEVKYYFFALENNI
jgi:hypothetical protein